MLRPSRRLLPSLIILLGLLAAACAEAQTYEQDARWLADVLALTDSSVVADVGAGEGELTVALAEHVGPAGRIYSTELGEESVAELRPEIEEAGLSHVTVRAGRPLRTNLPEGCCDALVMRRVYHHIDEPEPWNESLYRTLRPGGRLAIIDFLPWGGAEAEDPENRDEGDTHGVTLETVVAELERAGFAVLSSELRDEDDVYVVARRPADS